MKYYVYQHTVPSGEIIYIGKGSGNRKSTCLPRNKVWDSLSCNGVTSQILYCTDDEDHAYEVEEGLIKKHSPKANILSGGKGDINDPSQMSKLMTSYWASKTKEEKDKILSPSHEGVRKMWASMSPEEKSKEQSRRSKHRANKKVLRLDTGKIYFTTKEAAEDIGCINQTVISVCNGSKKHIKGIRLEYVQGDPLCRT